MILEAASFDLHDPPGSAPGCSIFASQVSSFHLNVIPYSHIKSFEREKFCGCESFTMEYVTVF